MGGKLILAVSTPCNTKGKPSGYRLLQYSNERLSIIPQQRGNCKADIDTNVQAFCYLKPRERNVAPECVNSSLMDSSDYMLLAKSNGFIEIIQDYQYKIENDISLQPMFILKCIPEDYSDFGSDCMIAGLQYREGLLYCCMCSGKLYLFVLNLPYDYVQSENSFMGSHSPERLYCSSSQIGSTARRDSQSLEEATFYLNMKFTGRSKLKHICYYLLPMEPEHLRMSPSMFLFSNMYKERIIFKPSIFVELDQGVSAFRINPLDRFSFFTVSPRSPLMIRKIMLPMAYVDFFVTFIGIKKRIQQTKAEEITSWNKLAKDVGYDSFINWVIADPTHEVDNIGSVSWDELARYDGISNLRTIIVWIQRQGNTKDDIYKLFHRGAFAGSNYGSRITGDESSPSSRRRRSPRYGVQRGGLRETVDLPCSTNWELDSFIRDIRKNTFTVDFKIVQSNFESSHDEGLTQPRGEEETRTSFLTDNYKDMDIICIDRYLSLSAFRPKYFDVALTKIDSFHNWVDGNDTRQSVVDNEDSALRRALSTLSSFKKLFMLTATLCMVLDTNGVLLIDRRCLSDSKVLPRSAACAIRIVTFNIGLISDAVLVVSKLQRCRDCEGDDVFFELIVTCIPGEIMAFKGKFLAHSKIGEIVLCDSLRLNRKNRFVDKLCLLNYEPSCEDRKRHYDGHQGYPVITKRPKWE